MRMQPSMSLIGTAAIRAVRTWRHVSLVRDGICSTWRNAAPTASQGEAYCDRSHDRPGTLGPRVGPGRRPFSR